MSEDNKDKDKVKDKDENQSENQPENQPENSDCGIVICIPVIMMDFSVIEREFSNMRVEFNREMSNMEDEMAKYHEQLKDFFGHIVKTVGSSEPTVIGSSSESKAIGSSPESKVIIGPSSSESKAIGSSPESKVIGPSSSEPKSIGSQVQENSKAAGGQIQGTLLNLLNNSPLVQKDGDKDILRLRFYIGNFTNEEVDVKVIDGKLIIRALHDEITDNKKIHKEYNYDFIIPNNINPNSIKSSLSEDGVLTVEAELPPPPASSSDTPQQSSE